MNETLQHTNTEAAHIDPWPPGWPLPLTAVLPSLRWEDVVAVYLAYCAAIWGVEEGPALAG
jgi:hypothetical protein